MEAQPGRNIPGVRPSPNTPSDVSCSSGPCSVVSTRETSPASSTHYPLEATSAARDLFISCPDHHAAAAAAIPSPGPDQSRPHPRRDLCRPRGLSSEIPSSPLEMNPNPFQPVSGRRSKLAPDDPRALSHTSSAATTDEGNIGHHRFQNAALRRSLAPIPSHHTPSVLAPSSTIPRGGVCTPAWRGSTASVENLTEPSPTSSLTEFPHPSRDTHFRDFSTASSSALPYSTTTSNFDQRNSSTLLGHTTYVSVADLSSNRRSSTYRNEASFPSYQRSTSKMHPETGKLIADADMDRAMCYCFDRGDGQYTRLVPADLLPVELKNIPRRVATDDGMIVLPVPRQPGPDGQPADIQLESQPIATPPSSPNGVPTDNIQSRIDSIINASPGPGSGTVVLAARGFDGITGTPTRTPTTTNQYHSAGGSSSARREKIYCDKWIHDGTCAFTQQGCKYKHEMPHDRETQEKLGLFHGYPQWWKKQAVEQQRPLTIDDRPVNLITGRPPHYGLTASTSMGSGLSSAVVSSNWRTGPGPMGDSGIQRSPSSPTPAGSGSALGRAGSIGFGGGGRGSARQPRTFASFQPTPSYGPIGPPSRTAGSASGSGSGTMATSPTTTRHSRALTASSLASGSDNSGGGGAPYNNPNQRSAYDSGNPFAPLGEITRSARPALGRREESSSGDTTADGDGEQRGAPL